MGSVNSKSRFSQKETLLLKATFKDLAIRSPNAKTIDKKTFLQFFPLPGMQGERLFAVFDYQELGVINYEEFITGLGVICRGSFDEKVRFMFELYDIDDTNTITHRELHTMLLHIPHNELICLASKVMEKDRELKESSPQRKIEMKHDDLVDMMAEQAFTECNLDTKGALSFEQFKQWVKSTPEVIEFLESVFPVMINSNSGKEGSEHGGSIYDSDYNNRGGTPVLSTVSVDTTNSTIHTSSLSAQKIKRIPSHGHNLFQGGTINGSDSKPSTPSIFNKVLRTPRGATPTLIFRGSSQQQQEISENDDNNVISIPDDGFNLATATRVPSRGPGINGSADKQRPSSRLGRYNSATPVTINEEDLLDNNTQSPDFLEIANNENSNNNNNNEEEEGVVYKGTLFKVGRRFHKLKARWFVLAAEDNLMYYYQNKHDTTPLGVIFLEGCFVNPTGEGMGEGPPVALKTEASLGGGKFLKYKQKSSRDGKEKEEEKEDLKRKKWTKPTMIQENIDGVVKPPIHKTFRSTSKSDQNVLDEQKVKRRERKNKKKRNK